VLARRLLLLLAVLIGLTALAGGLAPAPAPQPQGRATPGPLQASPAPGSLQTVRATLSAARDVAARRILARVGDQVSITVRAQHIDTVGLGDLDSEPVEPGLPAHFDLLADTAGSYPLVLLQAGRRIGTLVVRQG
jgi:hypothetical protein